MSGLRKTINWLSRSEVVSLLESIGIACYDEETDTLLRDALQENVESGEISEASVEAFPHEWEIIHGRKAM